MIEKGYSKRTICRVLHALLLLFICFVSCQTEEKEDLKYEGHYDGKFMILPVFHQHRMEATTKALLTGYSEFTPNEGELIYAWAKRYAPTDSLIEGEFRSSISNNKVNWYSSVEVKSGHSYRLFAFHPGGITTDRDRVTFTESNGAFRLSVDPINIVTVGEPSIAIAATRSVYENGAYTDLPPTPGSFDLGAISSNLNKDKVLLAMNHLYSKLNMSFTLDTVYSKLRSIVITKIQIVSATGQSSMNLTFNQYSTPTYGAIKGDSLKVSMPIPGDSIVLNKTTTTQWEDNVFSYKYINAGSFCYLPKDGLPVKLVVEYNVYTGDISDDPLTPQNYEERLARKGQTATNGKIMPSGNNIPQAGYQYNVNIRVKPSYLYVLTDDDLDIPLPIE